MPNLPYQTSGWNTHTKVNREIRFPLRTSLTVLEVEFTYEGPLATYIAIPYASIEPAYSAEGVTLYLCAQGNLENIGGGAIRYTRTWCSLPPQQTVYSGQVIDRPVLHDIFSGSSYAVSFDNGVTSHVFSARTSATIGTVEPPAATNGNTPGALGHVLISIELNNSAQTFYADDNNATIWAALSSAVSGNPATYASSAYFPILRNNGTLVIGNATISCTLKALSSSDQLTRVEVGSGRLLGTGAAGVDLLQITALDATIDSVRRITTTIAAVAGRYIALWNEDKLAATGKVVATNGSTYCDVQLATVPGKDFAVTHAAVAGVTASVRYVNGPTSGKVATKHVSDFYLPGVTSGITTPADIPVIATKLDPITWLGEILAYVAGGSLASYFTAIDGTPMERWLGGPIYQQTTISCQMKDTLETVSTTA